MAELLNFLNHVLPPTDKGYRCWVAIKDKTVTQGFCKTNEELNDILRGVDTRQWNAYFACSTYKEPLKRTQENVNSISALWLDIDAGKGKPYANVDEAKDALNAFIQKTNLPPPLVVCSGYGLHVYWPLVTTLDYARWKALATKFKAFVSAHGLRAGPERTSDAASILRAPGTLNYKYGQTAEVYLLEANIQPSDKIIELLQVHEGIPQLDLGVMPKGKPDMYQGYPDGERTDQLTRRAGYCLGPGKMTVDETIKACLDWNKHNIPPLDEDKIVKTVQSIGAREFSSNKKPSITFEASEPQPLLPFGFKWGPRNEILASVPDPDAPEGEDKYINITLCENPFYVLSMRENETNGVAGARSVKFKVKTAHEPWKTFTVKCRDLEGPSWKAAMAEYGIRCTVGRDKLFKQLINGMLQGREDMARLDICYNSFGWKNDRTAFVAGRKLHQNGSTLDVSGTPEFEKAADRIRANPKGSFKKWRAVANRVFAPGCEAQAFGLLCSFAAPLMDLLFAADEGGSILSLVSTKSGQGKTAGLAAIESVWGETGCLRVTENESLAAKFRAIGVRKNMPIVIDEYAADDIDIAAKFIKIFTGGLDKKRLTMHGEDIKEQLTWKTVLIGTTNEPVVDKLKQNNYAAQAVRIFEINVAIPQHLAGTQTSEINKEFERNSGFAGPVFIRHIIDNYDLNQLEEKINNIAKAFGSKLRLGTDYRFKTRLVAACAVVAQIVTSPIAEGGEPMLEFNPKRIIQWALSQIEESVKETSVDITAEQILMDFIRDNLHNFAVVDGPFNPHRPTLLLNRPKQKLMGRYEKETARLYIPNDIIRKNAVSVRMPYVELARALTEQGIVLNRNRLTSLSAGIEEMPPTRASCWEIDLTHEKAVKGLALVNMLEAGKINDKIRIKNAMKRSRTGI